MSDLSDFFKLVSEDKKKKKEEFDSVVGDLGLDSLFGEFAALKKKEKEKKVEEQIEEEFIIQGAGGTGVRLDKDTVYQIGRSGIGTISDTLTLAVAVLDTGVSNAVAYGAMTWIEQR